MMKMIVIDVNNEEYEYDDDHDEYDDDDHDYDANDQDDDNDDTLYHPRVGTDLIAA
jgi:hypothetical protein